MSGAAPTAVFFVMFGAGHFQRMESLIAAVVEAGMRATVFAEARFAARAQAAGARFEDLYEGRPMDDVSRPAPSRYLPWAWEFGDEILEIVRRHQPQIVVTDSFAVIGRVVASELRLPYVNVCSGHNVHPSRFIPTLREDPRVDVTQRCLDAARRLHERWGVGDGSPFGYVTWPSPFLNIYCEPREYLSDADRASFEPVEFFGSLPRHAAESAATRRGRRPASDERLIYVSFGTIIWTYYAEEAIRALRAVSHAVAALPSTRALVSLGETEIGPQALSEIERANVRVESYVDQWSVLAEADAFVTHNGLNSTHEAIFHGVPMASYPFFWDQPGLARLVQSLGLAVPLAGRPREPVDHTDVGATLRSLEADRDALDDNLERARAWEERTLRHRPEVAQRILALAQLR